MEGRELTVNILSDRISAQTAAYVEMSNALVKIIEHTADTRERIIDLSHFLKEDIRAVSSKNQDILLILSKLSTEGESNHNLMTKDVDALLEKAATLNVKINELMRIAEISAQAMTASSKITADQIIDSNYSHITELGKMSTEYKNLTSSILEELRSQTNDIQNFKTFFDKVKYYWMALLGMITLFGILAGFKIITISWFVK